MRGAEGPPCARPLARAFGLHSQDIKDFMNQLHSRGLFALRAGSLKFAALAAFLLVISATAARSEEFSYSLAASENLSVLLNDSMHNEMMAAWTTPMTLVMKRNRPYLLLTNTSTVADLTSFTLNIGTHANMPAQTFDWARIISSGTSPGVNATLVTPDTLDEGSKSPDIVYNFTGFAPGDQVLFQVDIDPVVATAFPFADYRQVFFTINGGADTTGNATTSASFNDPNAVPPDATLGPTVWENPVDDRHTNYGMTVAAHYMDDFVRTFETSDVTAVPEPNSFVLIGLGSVGLLLLRRCGESNKDAA